MVKKPNSTVSLFKAAIFIGINATNINVMANKYQDTPRTNRLSCLVETQISTNDNWQLTYNNKKVIENMYKIKRFSEFRNNWNGYKAKKIPKTLLKNTELILLELNTQPEIFPTGRGTIQFEYSNSKNGYFEIEMTNTSYSYFYIKDNSKKEGSGKTFISSKALNKLINEFNA